MWNERTALLIGSTGTEILKKARIAVFGVGGVGSYAMEMLVRAGIVSIDVIDDDVYTETNLNRQLFATLDTLGKFKAEIASERASRINPECKVRAFCLRYDETTTNQFDMNNYDYVVDAIDSLDCKTLLIRRCYENGVRIISSMGAGNKLDPGKFKVCDVFSTSYDPLAKEMRRRLKTLGIKKLKCVCSTEEPIKTGERTVGSMAYVTASAGILMAGEVINDILKKGI